MSHRLTRSLRFQGLKHQRCVSKTSRLIDFQLLGMWPNHLAPLRDCIQQKWGVFSSETIGKSAAEISTDAAIARDLWGQDIVFSLKDESRKKNKQKKKKQTKKCSSPEWPWHEFSSKHTLSLALAQNTASNRLFRMASPLETLFLHLSCLSSFPLLICPSAWQAQSPRLPLSRRTPHPRVAFSLCLTRRDRLLNFLMGDLLKSLLTTLVVYKGWLKEIVHLFSAASTKEIKKKKKTND